MADNNEPGAFDFSGYDDGIPDPIPGMQAAVEGAGHSWETLTTRQFGYDASGKVGSRKDGYVIHGDYGTTMYMGRAEAGTDHRQMLGMGMAVNKKWAGYKQFVDQEIDSMSTFENATRAADGATAWLEDIQEHIADNPWGEGPDAAAAALAFETQFVQNDTAALREMTDLQLRQYGGLYQVKGSEIMQHTYDADNYMSTDDSSEARQARQMKMTHPKELGAFAWMRPTNDLSAIEQYKLNRYEHRNAVTGKAVGSGDDGFNPLGLAEEDRYTPGAFLQEKAEYDQMRLADRSAKQSGKESFTKRASEGAQL